MAAGDRYPAASDPIRQFADDLNELRRRISELEARSSDTGRVAGIAVSGSASPGEVLTATASGVADWLPVSTGGSSSVVFTSTAAGVVTLNLTHGAVQVLTLTGSITSLSVAGASAGMRAAFEVHLIQDGTGGRTVAWPASWKWVFGIQPHLSTAPGARDRFACETLDGGVTVYADILGKAYA